MLLHEAWCIGGAPGERGIQDHVEQYRHDTVIASLVRSSCRDCRRHTVMVLQYAPQVAIRVLVKVTVAHGIWSFPGVVRELYGDTARLVLDIAMAIFNFICCVIYLIAIGTVLHGHAATSLCHMITMLRSQYINLLCGIHRSSFARETVQYCIARITTTEAAIARWVTCNRDYFPPVLPHSPATPGVQAPQGSRCTRGVPSLPAGDLLAGALSGKGEFNPGLLVRAAGGVMAWWNSRPFLVGLTTVLFVLPLTLLGRVDSLQYSSAASLVAATGIVVFLVVLAGARGAQGQLYAPRLTPAVYSLDSAMAITATIPVRRGVKTEHL